MPYNYNYYNKPKKSNRNERPDHQAGQRMEFERNRKRILVGEDICGICGRLVDKNLKYPHPMSATVDHIIPVSKGGHPSDMDNLQLAHFCCNRQKSDKVMEAGTEPPESAVINNRELPLSLNWARYNETNQDELREEVKRIEANGGHLYAVHII